MKLSIVSVTAIAATLSASAAFAQDKVKFEYWYGLSGQLGDVVQQTCDRFHASQDEAEVTGGGPDG